MATDLAELLERVKAATNASQELDACIMAALAAPQGSYVEKSRFNGVWCVYEAGGRLWEKRGWWREGGWPVTASLDAALALVERVLPDGECQLEIKTAAIGFGEVWKDVVADFVGRHSPGGLKFSINDGGARPDTVSLRLAQAVRLIEEAGQ